MNNRIPSIIKKIVNVESDTYIIFFVEGCPYCDKARELLKENRVRYKGYDINTIDGGMPELLRVLVAYKDLINFDPKHITKPIIFYNKKFIGGKTELEAIINSRA